MSLIGKTAIVTGAGRGIGRAICLRLAGLGAQILICDAGSLEEAEITRELCQKQGVQALVVQADVRLEADCERVFAACEAQLGAPYILVNNAGITRDNLLARMSEQDFVDVLDVNLKGAFHCTKLAYKPMSKNRAGRIVNISSVVGINGNAGQANYAASKAGLIGLTKSTAQEYARRNITVNAIAPGFIATEMTERLPQDIKDGMLAATPLNRFGSPEDVAAAVAFLAGDDAAFITGQVLRVDGGMGM